MCKLFLNDSEDCNHLIGSYKNGHDTGLETKFRPFFYVHVVSFESCVYAKVNFPLGAVEFEHVFQHVLISTDHFTELFRF